MTDRFGASIVCLCVRCLPLAGSIKRIVFRLLLGVAVTVLRNRVTSESLLCVLVVRFTDRPIMSGGCMLGWVVCRSCVSLWVWVMIQIIVVRRNSGEKSFDALVMSKLGSDIVTIGRVCLVGLVGLNLVVSVVIVVLRSMVCDRLVFVLWLGLISL